MDAPVKALNTEKAKALQAALAQIEKQFGKGSVMRMDANTPVEEVQTVSTGSQCTGSATISGLQSGKPYVVWLDAPDTPRRTDGSRSLYSGRSGVVRPQ